MVFRILLLLISFSFASFAQPNEVVLLFTGNLQGQLNGFAPESDYSPLSMNDDSTTGGFARIASMIKNGKAQANGKVLTIDMGDYLIGSAFSAFEWKTGFQLGLMKQMGYDAIAFGNKDFEYGQKFLTNSIYNSIEKGEVPALLLSNIVFDKKNYDDNEFALLYTKDIIKSYQVFDMGTTKIGLVAVMGDLAENDAENLLPLTISDPAKAVQQQVDYLRNKEGVNYVVVVVHGALAKDKNGAWSGDVNTVAEKVKGVDLIVSNASENNMSDPVMLNNIPVVCAKAEGKTMGKVTLLLDGKQLEVKSYKHLNIDDKVMGDANINDKITHYQSLVDKKLLAPFNVSYEQQIVECDFPIYCNIADNNHCDYLGMLVADALHQYINKQNTAHVDVSIVASDMLQDNLLEGPQIPTDFVRMLAKGKGENSTPGFPLTKFYVTIEELKSIMELAYSDANNSQPVLFYTGGIKAKFNENGDDYKKVVQLDVLTRTRQFLPLDLSSNNEDLYGVVANTYSSQVLLAMAKQSKGKVKIEPKTADGVVINNLMDCRIDQNPLTEKIEEVKDWGALLYFVQQFKDSDGNGIPNIPERYNPNRDNMMSIGVE